MFQNEIFQEVTSGKWKWTMTSIIFEMSSLKRKLVSNWGRHSITKKMTAGKLVLEGHTFHLDENVLEQAGSFYTAEAI